jgi:hypothetical protein
MTCFSKAAAGLMAAAVLAAPSAASAHSDPSVKSVRSHARSADKALAVVADKVKDRDQAAAAIAMVRNLRQTQAATREAGRVRGRSDRARALRLVTAQRAANVRTLAEVVDEVSGDVQVDMVAALTSNLTGRERAIAKLTALAPTLPAAAQSGIARAIAAISARGAQDLENMATAARSGRIEAGALPQLQQAMAIASGAMFTGVGQLQQIVGMLPGPAQGPVNDAIARVTGILQGIFGGGGTAGTPGGMPANLPVPANLPIPANLPVPCGLPIPSFLPFAKAC